MVNLLHCGPGRADRPGNGEPISIVTLEHNNEIDMPLMLNLRDTKTLAVSLLSVLAHHGDAKAERVVSEFYNDTDQHRND